MLFGGLASFLFSLNDKQQEEAQGDTHDCTSVRQSATRILTKPYINLKVEAIL
jgi:hypothetical protein